MTDYSNIKVKPETFEMLKENKPDGVTWDRYLRSAVNTWDGMRDI